MHSDFVLLFQNTMTVGIQQFAQVGTLVRVGNQHAVRRELNKLGGRLDVDTSL